MDERDLPYRHRQPSYFAGCLMSPPCFPMREEAEYSRIHYENPNINKIRSRIRWRNILRRLVRDSKSLYGSTKGHLNLSFHYDAVSYSQNFDDGVHCDQQQQQPRRFSAQVFAPDYCD
ncbi:DNA polymerase zeta catalytic subunit like [Quillaja saponaria]|uniref:DNA polymerase zeta catalytic subunit like n=1 Tax=Quillaja saponaria TaxID=32244 RepID=A0AAD7PFA4_QUISA|nr:DNA polymerase zeta catalytic subunit like [Quillaja saponaria]